MKRLYLFFLTVILISICVNETTYGINTKDTRMMSQPAISASRIAFIYAEDLWAANIDGSQPVRLTVDEGVESNPCFSPDGKLIAFSAQYDGNTDVYVIPVDGGVPTRLTWHPGEDIVKSFTPDGKSVLFASRRSEFSNRYFGLYTIKTGGGFPESLQIPNAWSATYSPDGMFMAYTPLTPSYQQWKKYRGGCISNILIFSFTDHSSVRIPQPEGGCNDDYPMWIGDKIYFLSDRNGEFNLFSFDKNTNETRQLTHFTDFPVLKASAGEGKIIFEQAGYLHTFTPSSDKHEKMTIGIAADLLELRTRYVQGSKYTRTVDISPTGSRAVFDIRGEIVTFPAEKGDPRNITLTTAVHENYPSWSPDGKSIAYFSDASGEYNLHIKPQDGKGDTKILKLNGTGFYAYLTWAPDSKKISYVDNGRSLYIIDVESGSIVKIDSDETYSPGDFRQLFGDWSSDSKWITYTKAIETNYRVAYLYSLDQKKSFPVSDGLSDVSDPKLDPNGEYLYFFASTDAGPVVNWFDLSSMDNRATSSIYLVTLRKDVQSPFTKESDEETIKEEKKPDLIADDKVKADKKKSDPKDKSEKDKPESLKIDTDGLQERIINIPVKAGLYKDLSVGATGEIGYLALSEDNPGSSELHKYSLKDREDKVIMECDWYVISADRSKMIYASGESIGITAALTSPQPGKGLLNIDAISVKVDPLAEWPQIFDEAWRINRDYFYDPNMHGADWPAMKEKYSVFLPDLACRSDLNRLIQWMCSELCVGHHRVYGPYDQMGKSQTVGVGLLGADYVISDNRYRIAKIYGGLNWSPDLKSPLTEPGLNVKNGDYILAVNGNDVTADKNIYSFFENTQGKIVELTIGEKPDYKGSRVIKVVPVSNEYSLRNRDWVEGNLKKVTEATNGQVAYVYVPNTAGQGYEYFKRYFYPQANRKAIIVDERFNGGGALADYYIDLLQRPLQAYWNMRYGKSMKSPSASIQGPKVLITDETAGSGGDFFPWMFRKFNVGTIVGKRTWGGLVGILGYPEFIDGGGVTAPNSAIWTEEGFIVENEGVAPDIEVEQSPAEVINGHDPQLEKAIEVALDELAKNPQKEPVMPPHPVKAGK